MNARTQTKTAALAAMALTLVMTASLAVAAPRNGAECAKKSAACRTVENYTMSAWMAPVAMVLHSAAQWEKWNERMAEEGLAVAAEALPANVDWSKEAVLVLALGELSDARRMSLTGVTSGLNGTRLNLKVEAGHGGRTPALVLAMSKSAAGRLSLASNTMGLPECRTYSETNLAGDAMGEPVAVATSWGAMKAEYR